MRAEVLILISLSAVACGQSEVLIPPSPENDSRRIGTVRERLVDPQLFDLEVGSSAMALTAPHRRLVHEVPLEPRTARVAVAATDEGLLRLSEVAVPFAAIEISLENFAPEGASIEGLVLRLTFLPMATTWTEDGDGVARFEGAARLHADWQLTTPRGSLGARPIDVPSMPVAGTVVEDASGGLVLDVQCAGDGPLFDWGGLLVISDLRLALTFAEVVPTAPRTTRRAGP